jgi:hypothetical protein
MIEFPTVAEVAEELRAVQMGVAWDDIEEGEPGVDVRLQVGEGGSWAVHSGDASYDTDHSGFWGAGSLDAITDCDALAAELIEEAKDHAAQCGE